MRRNGGMTSKERLQTLTVSVLIPIALFLTIQSQDLPSVPRRICFYVALFALTICVVLLVYIAIRNLHPNPDRNGLSTAAGRLQTNILPVPSDDEMRKASARYSWAHDHFPHLRLYMVVLSQIHEPVQRPKHGPQILRRMLLRWRVKRHRQVVRWLHQRLDAGTNHSIENDLARALLAIETRPAVLHCCENMGYLPELWPLFEELLSTYVAYLCWLDNLCPPLKDCAADNNVEPMHNSEIDSNDPIWPIAIDFRRLLERECIIAAQFAVRLIRIDGVGENYRRSLIRILFPELFRNAPSGTFKHVASTIANDLISQLHPDYSVIGGISKEHRDISRWGSEWRTALDSTGIFMNMAKGEHLNEIEYCDLVLSKLFDAWVAWCDWSENYMGSEDLEASLVGVQNALGRFVTFCEDLKTEKCSWVIWKANLIPRLYEWLSAHPEGTDESDRYMAIRHMIQEIIRALS